MFSHRTNYSPFPRRQQQPPPAPPRSPDWPPPPPRWQQQPSPPGSSATKLPPPPPRRRRQPRTPPPPYTIFSAPPPHRHRQMWLPVSCKACRTPPANVLPPLPRAAPNGGGRRLPPPILPRHADLPAAVPARAATNSRGSRQTAARAPHFPNQLTADRPSPPVVAAAAADSRCRRADGAAGHGTSAPPTTRPRQCGPSASPIRRRRRR